jgi:anti-sigma factor (TIGR02949 family)
MTEHRYSCEEVIRRLDLYLDRELGHAELRRVAAHVASCAACARKTRHERRLIDLLRVRLRRVDVPPDLARRVTRLLAAGGTRPFRMARSDGARRPPLQGPTDPDDSTRR